MATTTRDTQAMLASLQAAAGNCVREANTRVIAEPPNAEAASALLAHCSAEGWSVALQGARTWLNVRHGIDETTDVAISTRAMRGVNDYEPEDLTVSVAAGTSIDELATVLRANNQWLALDPPALTGSTVGALVATASAGPMRARYGTPRDHVLGLDIITGDGRSLHFGGNVVKNVAGYDLTRPIVGSQGTLGLITRVSLRLRPMPAADETFAMAADSIEDCLSCAYEIDNTWPVAALEIVSGSIAVNTGAAIEVAPARGWVILVRVQGHPQEIREAESRFSRIGPIHSMAEASALWRRLSELEASANAHARLAAKVTDLAHTIKTGNRLADHGLTGSPSIAIHAATGIVRVWGEPAGSEMQQAVQTAGVDMLSVDGTVIWNGILTRADTIDARRDQIENDIRAIFDPAGILARSAP